MGTLKREGILTNLKYKSSHVRLEALNVVASSTTRKSMVGFIIDLPNICTLFGLLSALLGIYFAIQNLFYFAIICGAWAVLFDLLDGMIASKMKGRSSDDRAFGGQLDSLIDIVSFGVLPAIILLSYSDYNPWFIPGAFAVIAACAIRLSYFNIYGLTEGKTYTGLAVDNNGLIMSFAFLFESLLNSAFFSTGLLILLMVVVAFNLAPIQIPKFSKKMIYGIAVYVTVITVFLGRMQQ
jgi:CDP-diacylglycerol--serine O-phosphatidyltransferase